MRGSAERLVNLDDQTGAVLEALERGATLLTPNVRAARLWADRYDARAAGSGKVQSWRAASILPWRAWTASLWGEAIILGVDSRVLLNDVQDRAVWTAVLTRLSTGTLRSVPSQVALCMEATKLLGSYDTEARFLNWVTGHADSAADAATFHGWYVEFERVCSREGYLPSSHLELELPKVFSRHRMTAGNEYLLCGFTDLTPAQRVIVEALQATGAVIEQFQPSVASEQAPSLLAYQSTGAELLGCALWIREQLEMHPSQSVAMVVPDLHTARTEIERELRTVVAPATADVTRTDAAPYEFSSGRPLRQLPMIHAALQLLRWCAEELSVDDAGALLRSRFLSLAGSAEAGAEQDVYVLRARPRLRKTLSLRQAARELVRYGTTETLAALDRDARPLRTASNTFAWFADHVRALLETAGWPGRYPLDSDAFQAADRWDRMLDGLASLDLLGRAATFDGFLKELEALAGRTLFAPENLHAPVQVISVAEAAGCTADTMWFLHAGANTWPVRRTPHPLLPLPLQQELGMPGTDLLRDEAAAQLLLEALLHSVGSVRFSWNAGNGEDASGPSPLIERLVAGHGGLIADAPDAVVDDAPSLLEMCVDDEVLPSLQDGHVAGGVGVLTAQAQCGFRAFAEKRLFAAPIEALDAGLSPRERGEQVHAVLQMFWSEVRDQHTLITMAREMTTDGGSKRDQLLRRCIDTTCRVDRAEPWDDAYLHVQQMRLFKLLSAWLDIEADRPPFRVLQLEQEIKDVPVGPLRLNMRVDRIDRVTAPEGDGTVLIDYKTGPSSTNDWLGERPDAPQLPAYAVAGALAAGVERVDGLLFASVRVGAKAMKFDGMAESPALIGKTSDKHVFAEQVEHWRNDLEELANAFARGDASVDPKNYPKTCDLCAQRILCRVDAGTLLQIEEIQAEQDEAAEWT